jgi:hypothetical protein
MDESFETIEERFERLSRATEGVHPSSGFDQRVLLAVAQAASVDWRVGLWRLGRYGLVASLVAVALATVLAMQGASRADEMQATTYGTVDLEW